MPLMGLLGPGGLPVGADGRPGGALPDYGAVGGAYGGPPPRDAGGYGADWRGGGGVGPGVAGGGYGMGQGPGGYDPYGAAGGMGYGADGGGGGFGGPMRGHEGDSRYRPY
eukprot:3312903-Rhodomonas_salina.1